MTEKTILPKLPIRLILLDFDGTLADTRRANARAYAEALKEVGFALPEEVYAARYFGMRCEEFLSEIGIADPECRESVRKRKIEIYPRYFDSVRLNEPLWNFCQQFRRQGGRVWVVSTGSRDNIENVMRHLGIRAGVDGIIAGPDVARSKPHPDPFLEAMRREGVAPGQTLIFEDSEIGIEAAKSSGAPYFVVRL